MSTNEDAPAQGDVLTDATRRRLVNARRAMLRLHKVLLDAERAAYERVRGQVTSGELLQLVIHDAQFAWLHALSELIVRIDEFLDSVEPATNADAGSLIDQARQLITPSETGDEFARRYFAALQSEPDAVLAHREATAALSDGG